MRAAPRWLLPAAALFLLPLNIPSLADDSLWQKFIVEARQFEDKGLQAEAEKRLQLGLAEAENFGPHDQRLAMTLNELAALYHASERLSEAEPLYRKSLGIWENFPDRLELATALNNLARLCLDRENYSEVERLSTRALALSESLAPSGPEVANSLINLANVSTIRGRYETAEPLYRRALMILEKSFGSEHRGVAYGLGQLGKLSFLQARYSEAEATQRRAIAILRNAKGQKTTLASILNSLADTVAYKGRNAEAEELYQQAQLIWEQLLGADHPNIGVSLNNRARLCRKLGRFADAEALYSGALAIWEKTPGQEQLEVIGW